MNNGNNMHGSQFFITLADGIDSLDGVHSVFGEVGCLTTSQPSPSSPVCGMWPGQVAEDSFPILDKINATIVDDKNLPYQDIRCGLKPPFCPFQVITPFDCLEYDTPLC